MTRRQEFCALPAAQSLDRRRARALKGGVRNPPIRALHIA